MKRVKALALRVVLACAVLAFAGVNAQALNVSDSDSFANQLTELAGNPLRVDQFNSALGTLKGVKVTLSGNLTSAGDVTNTAAQSQTFTVSTRVEEFLATLATGGPSALSNYEVVAPFTLINSQKYTDLGSGTTAAFGPGAYDTGVLEVFTSTDPAALAGFIGTDTFGYDFTTSILTSISGGGGNVSSLIETLAGATLAVEYTYDEVVQPPPPPVPEPSTMLLLGLGMAGLLTIGRKRITK